MLFTRAIPSFSAMAMSRVATGDAIIQAGRKLDLRDRNLSTEDVATLARIISVNSRLEILSLYNVKLKSDDAVVLARALEFNSTLATLNFTHNPIGEVGTAALAEVIKFNTGLTQVSLANTLLNPQGCALLADALIMNRSLTRLNLEKNHIGAAGAQYLAAALRANESLRALFLDGNHIGDPGAVAISTALSADGGSRLEMLSLANTGITEEGAKALGDALQGNLWLKKLVMAKVELLPQVLQGREEESEGTAVAASKGLQTVDLSGQPLSATLDYPIACRLIKDNPRLARLRLARAGLCGVTAAGRGRRSIWGLRALSLTLEASPARLVVLDLGHNFLDDDAAVELARGLEKNAVLRSIVLHGNGIGAKGIKALAGCLPSSIVELDVSNNPSLGQAGGVAIGRFLTDFVRSAKLRRLDVSKCNLGDLGMQMLAEGLQAAKGLEWLGLEGNLNGRGGVAASRINGSGKLSIGLALLGARDLRLQGLFMDLWDVSKGQKELKLVRPRGTVACQLPTTADVCLLSGIICCHDWLRAVVLDGNPIDESGMAHLCQALIKNRKVQSLSLKRCGLGDQSGSLLLQLLAEKPGLEVDAAEGNHYGEELSRKLLAALEDARGILSSRVETRRTTVHLLGDAGSGKSCLRESMVRGFFTSLFSTSSENARDRGADDASQRTLGVLSYPLPLGAGASTILVQDHGGLPCFHGMGALDSGLACPTSVYVVVVSLTADKQEQKRQIKYWLRVIQSVGPSSGSVLMLVGSRADQMGSVAQDYLQKLWERAREDLTREELRAGLDASLPTFAGCMAVDCRKSGDVNIGRLKEAIAHADRLFSEVGAGWLVPPLHSIAAVRLERWMGEGAVLVRWSDFVSGVQRQLCPAASEAACVELARSLSREGRVVSKGLSREKERERGKGWLVLRPSFLRDVLGGVFGADLKGKKATDGQGVFSTASVCKAVIGGLGSVDPESLVQALLDADICAELPPRGEGPADDTEVTNKTMKASPRSLNVPYSPSSQLSTEAGGGHGSIFHGAEAGVLSAVISSKPSSMHQSSFNFSSNVTISSTSGTTRETSRAGVGDVEEGDDENRTEEADSWRSFDRQCLRGRRKDCWERLERRRLVFPALLTEKEAFPGGGKGREDCDEGWRCWMERFGEDHEAFVFGRRVACRAPLLTPGLFHSLQARLANRYRGRVRLGHRVVQLSLDGWEAGSGGVIAGGEDRPLREWDDAALGPLCARVEYVEAQLAGGDAVDVSTASLNKKACFLAVRGIRLEVEQILSQAPSIAVEDLAIASESLRQGASPPERMTLPLSQIKHDLKEGREVCSFGDNSPPEPAWDLLWDGPEEFELDDTGRIVSAYSLHSRRSPAPASPAPTSTSIKLAANPFGPDFSSNKSHSPAAPASKNPFASVASTTRGSAMRTAVVTNPFASSPVGNKVKAQLSPRSPGDGSRGSVEGRGGDGYTAVGVESGLVAVRNPDVSVRDAGVDDAVGVAGAVEGVLVHEIAGARGSELVIPAAFSFDGGVFRDARRLFGGHLGGKSYHFGKQRVEVVLRRPGGLRLGIWRPPLDDREEREREKEKGRAASEKFDHELEMQKLDDKADAAVGDDVIRSDPGHTPEDLPSVSNSADSGNEVKGDTQMVGDTDVQQEALFGGAADMGAGPSSTAQDEPVTTGSSSRSRLGSERPAVLEEVLDEEVIADFNCLGTSDEFRLVGCVVASVSREPFNTTEVSFKLPTFEEVSSLTASKEYPLFIQLCRPPLLFTPEPEYPSVKLLTTLALTNRNVEKVDGEYRFGDLLEEDGRARWIVTTTAVPSDVGDLGTGMQINLPDFHVIGLYSITPEEAMALLAEHPSRNVFVYVHGFNTPFGYGVRSIAVKGRAFRKSLSVCLAWPSNPPGEGAGWLIKQVMSTYERRYTYCEHNMHATIFLFLQAALDMKAAADSAGKTMCWKGHSMGCYLLLNIVDRLRWKGEALQPLFRRVILDSPDVPTWFFSSMTKVLAENGVEVCHYFNPDDKAIYASCSRRALQRPVPGHDAIVAHPLLQGVLCDKARSSTGMNHDYGRADGRCLLDQRDFLAGEPPDQRVLEERVSAEGIACWQLKTW